MDKLRVAINGFGRIGRCTFRAAHEREKAGEEIPFEVTVINDLASPESLARLLRRDSTFGKFPGEVGYSPRDGIIKGYITVDGREVPLYGYREVPDVEEQFRKLGTVDAILECTGQRANPWQLRAYEDFPVVLSRPGKDMDYTVVLGVNDAGSRDLLAKEGLKRKRISNASCTTNSVAPPVYVIDNMNGVEILCGMLNTIHAYTGDQRLLDWPHPDPRRARCAAQNIIPTSTGAAGLVGELVPSLKNKFAGVASRVPVMDGSMSDIILNVVSQGELTKDMINDALKIASERDLKGIMEYLGEGCEEFVSGDIIGDPHSAAIDGMFTSVVCGGKVDSGILYSVRLLSWYDNEWGYSNRLVDLLSLISEYA